MLRSNVCEGLANSDHDAIEFALKVKIARRKCSPRLVYDYKNADWDGLKEDFRNIPWNCIDLVSDIKVVWSSWKSLFFKAVERNIPSKFLSSKRNVPWFNSDIKKLIHKKQRLWKIAKSSGSPDKWSNYKKLNNEVKDKLRKAYYRYVKVPLAQIFFLTMSNLRTISIIFLKTKLNLIKSFIFYGALKLAKQRYQLEHFRERFSLK